MLVRGVSAGEPDFRVLMGIHRVMSWMIRGAFQRCASVHTAGCARVELPLPGAHFPDAALKIRVMLA